MKLDWKKVLITIILTIIIFIGFGVSHSIAGNPFVGESIVFVLGLIPFLIAEFILKGIENINLTSLFLIVVLIYSYLLSCFLFLFLGYIKKKIKKGGLGKIIAFGLIIIFVIILTAAFYRDINFIRNYEKPGLDARRESDIRQISLAMEMYYDEYGNYPRITVDSVGSLLSESYTPNYLSPWPKDPGGSSYYAITNTPDTSKYCIYANMRNSGFFAASHKGAKKLEKEPINLDCW